ncbi:MAG: hypothetical protein LDL44_16015 [Caenispirillum sp.]|nr:hypothetical protein [Caenispirillum sp.]
MPTKKPSTASTWTDPDDAPPLDDAWFGEADLLDGDRVVREGGPGPKAPMNDAKRKAVRP